MFEISPMPVQIDAGLLERARLAEPAVIGHFRLRGFPDCNIRPQIPTGRIVGTVVTLTLPAFDSTLLHHAVGMLRAGDVLLIDRLGDHHHACLGGGVAWALSKAGVVAAIIDGPAADPAELREHGMPV